MQNKKTTIQLRIEKTLWGQLKGLSWFLEKSKEDLLNQAIADYVNKRIKNEKSQS